MGAQEDNIGANSRQGSAYVFVEPAGGWASGTETAKLTASDGAADDRFGSVAVSGDTVVVGASFDDIGAKSRQGSAYVFVEPGGSWASGTETAKLTAADGEVNDFFGNSVAVSGDTVVVGAFGDDIGANVNQGSAYVFVKPVGGWVTGTETRLTAADEGTGDNVGSSVAVSGDTVVVGASGGDGANVNQGSAYVFPPLLLPIELLKGDVEELVTNGSLTTGDGNSLMVKLESAIKKLQKGKSGGAISKLMALIDQVNGFISTGVLTAAEGDPLIDAANSIIDEILTG